MKIFLTTDTHFGHRKMEEYCGRPPDFESRILKKLAQTRPDILIHLGDFCIGNDERWHATFMQTLNKNTPLCKKWLVRGNHDHKSNAWYLSHGWDWVGHYFQDRIGGRNILFSHSPVMYKKLQSSLWGSDSFDVNIHGHFHNNGHREGEFNPGDNLVKYRLLAIENTDYNPVELESFLSSK